MFETDSGIKIPLKSEYMYKMPSELPQYCDVLFDRDNPKVKSKVKQAVIAQLIGYVFSGTVLGVGIAKLNIFITKYKYIELFESFNHFGEK